MTLKGLPFMIVIFIFLLPVLMPGEALQPSQEAQEERIIERVEVTNVAVAVRVLDKGKPVQDFNRFIRILREDILPLLEEYCYEDYTALEKILGRSMVDVNSQLIRHDLFDKSPEDIVSALLAPSPELSSSAQAISHEEEAEDDSSDEDDD